MAGIDVKTYIIAGVLTLGLFLSIWWLNHSLAGMREDKVTLKMNEILDEFEEIETMSYLQEYMLGQNGSCPSLIEGLNDMEEMIWMLDDRIKGYAEITQQVSDDSFYKQEKKKLNRRQLIYLTQLQDVKRACGYGQTEILYFYGDCYGNRRCDEQGFVLTYFNQRIDPEVAILSFDADRATPSIEALMGFYGIDELPCVVVEGRPFCGLHNKEEMMSILCEMSPHLSLCGDNN